MRSLKVQCNKTCIVILQTSPHACTFCLLVHLLARITYKRFLHFSYTLSTTMQLRFVPILCLWNLKRKCYSFFTSLYTSIYSNIEHLCSMFSIKSSSLIGQNLSFTCVLGLVIFLSCEKHLFEGKLNCTALDPWKQPYVIMNKTWLISLFVYRRKSWERFRILC